MPRHPFIRTAGEQLVEARFGRPISEVLHELYHDRHLSQAQIAEELGVNRTTVVGWMKRHGIPTGYNRTEGQS